MSKLYICYDMGQYVAKGTADYIATLLNIPQQTTVSYYALKNKKYHKRYTFEWTGEYYRKHIKKEEKKKEPTKHELDLEWIRIALNKSPSYMTCYKGDGREFIDELKAEGITFIAEKHPRDKGYYYLKRT